MTPRTVPYAPSGPLVGLARMPRFVALALLSAAPPARERHSSLLELGIAIGFVAAMVVMVVLLVLLVE